jgi:hypothetical protein
VAEFYGAYVEALRSFGLAVPMRPVPVEVETAIPFAEDRTHASYDPDAAAHWWRMMVEAQVVLQQFRGGFLGKAIPVHFFWGSFDLAVTRFSERRAPVHQGGAPNCPDYPCGRPILTNAAVAASGRAAVRWRDQPSIPMPIRRRPDTQSTRSVQRGPVSMRPWGVHVAI